MPNWRRIQGFTGYSVSDTGLIRNDDTERIMRLSLNSHGIVIVGLRKNMTQYKRSVSLLVATAFRASPGEYFDTPINLDGDKFNNHIDNLAWRPLWFARKYTQQFAVRSANSTRAIEELDSLERFPSAFEAAVRYGLLEAEIIMSLETHAPVWPTGNRFRAIY